MTSATHLAILGRQPELGWLELESLLGAANIAPFGKSATLFSGELEFDRLGGVVKLGEILYQGEAVDLLDLELDLVRFLRPEGKTSFGLSYYESKITPRQLLATGLELKKKLRSHGSVRLVSPTAGTDLGAAQLHHNKMLAEGFELLVVVSGQRMVVARTTAVQDIAAYAARDHGRPARSATVGMLPPKLAQILLNTTHERLVVDPFCGTGVVLQEALLMGRTAAGFDLSAEMVAASQTNLAWLADETPEPLLHWHVGQADARREKLPADEALAVVSEGYLGPNLSTPPSSDRLAELDREISQLYGEVLANWARQLPAGAEVTICLPNWRTKAGWHQPQVVDDLGKIGYTSKVFKHVPALVRYARPDQTVGRQILVLTRS
jgi:tRNA G10  N-methylase Trm11